MDLTCYVLKLPLSLQVKKEILDKLGLDSSPGTCIN